MRSVDAQLEKLIEVLAPPVRKAEELWILQREGDQLGWWERYSDVLPDNVEMLAGFEDGAGWVRQYDEAFLPVLLQTPEYAHAIVTSAAPYQRSADMPRIVEFRQQRQEKLRDPAFRYTAIVNEGALRRHVGGRDVMRGQLRYLLDTEYAATVELHVLPFEAGEHAAQVQAFSLITFPEPEDPEMVFADTGPASGFLERQTEIRQHTSAFSVAMSKVLDLAASRTRLWKVAGDIDC